MTHATKHWTSALVAINACSPAITWCETQPDLATAWANCERGDWMLWLAAQLATDRKPVVVAACACARLALPHAGSYAAQIDEELSIVEAWARGEVSREYMTAASDRLWRIHMDAAYAAYADAAAYAADAAAYAADAAAYAAYAAYADASASTLRQCSEICRALLKCPALDGGVT